MAGTVTGAAGPGTAGQALTDQQIQQQLSDPAKFTNVTWAALVLGFIGAPITQNNIDNFTSWMTSENAGPTWTGTAGTNNPLNNGLGSGGGSGLGSYPDLITAAYYAAKGIQGGIQNAAPIGAALKANAPFSVFHQATLNATWSGDHYAGTEWAGMTAPAPPPAVSVATAAKDKSTHSPSIGKLDFATLTQGGNFWSNIASSLNTLTGGVAGDAANAVKDTVGYTEELGKLLGDVLSANWWKRVGLFSLGVVLIIGGVVLFINTTQTGQRAESTALEAGELGAIA